MDLPEWLTEPNVADWMQGVGALLTVPIAVWSTVVAGRAKATVREAAEVGAWSALQGNDLVNQRLKEEGGAVWQIAKGDRSTRVFTNTGSRSVRLLGVEALGKSAQDVSVYDGFVGTDIDVGNSFTVVYERSLASPAVAQVEVEWRDGPRDIKQVYAVT